MALEEQPGSPEKQARSEAVNALLWCNFPKALPWLVGEAAEKELWLLPVSQQGKGDPQCWQRMGILNRAQGFEQSAGISGGQGSGGHYQAEGHM